MKLYIYNTETNVSIHAPARGATEIVDLDVDTFEFQSTRPRGARLAGRPLSSSRP